MGNQATILELMMQSTRKNTASSGAIPSHVPKDRVVDFDIYNFSIKDGDYARTLKNLTAPGLADLLWTPHQGGYWIVTRDAGIEKILNDHANFSSATEGTVKPVAESSPLAKCPFSFKRWLSSKARKNSELAKAPLVPLQLDPPEHAQYRRMIAEAFSPSHLAPVLSDTRAFAIELIEGLKSKGECEFFWDFAHLVPAVNFIQLLELPIRDRDFLIKIVGKSLRGEEKQTRRAFRKLVEYGMQQVRKRRCNSGSDLLSTIAAAQVDGQLLDDATVAGMVRLILLAGFDTVASMLGFFAHFLANHPGHRHELINHPELIPNAIEELLRRHANVMLTRRVRNDLEYEGVTLRRGDLVAVPTGLAGLDDRVVEEPLKVDFTRVRPHHQAFGDGPHRCLGAALAREELRIFLEEWLKRIPDFEVKPATEIKVVTKGPLGKITRLPLVWKTV